jgi:molybdenum cofactor biosynthesis enzyme MoaA
MEPTALASLARAILSRHHAFLHAEFPRLAVALAAESKQIRAPFEHLRRAMDEHMAREEDLLFPAILAMSEDGELPPIGVGELIAELATAHASLEVLADAMRAASRDAGVLEDEILVMLDDLAEHHRQEDEALFPAARALEVRLRARHVDAAPPLRDGEPATDASGDFGCAASAGAGDVVGTHPGHTETPVPTATTPTTRVVRRTRGVCSTCLTEVPAAVVVRAGEVLLERTCPTHGVSSQLLSRRPEYWAELDRYYFSVNREEYPQRDYIVRMTERCNLACPICLAKANTEDTPDLDLSGLAERLGQRRGVKIDLMAAEPTLRADLFDWVRAVKASGNIAALHTNGLKLADEAYVRELKAAGVDEVFLQFDGLDDHANKELRGRPLLKARLATLANLRAHGIATSLIVVIARDLNEAQVAETFRFALRPENSHIREVFFLGLRNLGSARHSGRFDDQMLMPDELIDLLSAQEPRLKRDDIHAFNKVYFAMLSAFKVRKCLYVQHYLVARDGRGGYTPVSDVLRLDRLAAAAESYAARLPAHPHLARIGLGAALVREGLHPEALRMAGDLVKLEQLFEKGMNLTGVPERFLLLGFITACDPENFDADVAINCGKGELSSDGGYIESGAVANVRREARFDASARDPGAPATSSARSARP